MHWSENCFRRLRLRISLSNGLQTYEEGLKELCEPIMTISAWLWARISKWAWANSWGDRAGCDKRSSSHGQGDYVWIRGQCGPGAADYLIKARWLVDMLERSLRYSDPQEKTPSGSLRVTRSVWNVRAKNNSSPCSRWLPSAWPKPINNGSISACNQKMCEITGYSFDECSQCVSWNHTSRWSWAGLGSFSKCHQQKVEELQFEERLIKDWQKHSVILGVVCETVKFHSAWLSHKRSSYRFRCRSSPCSGIKGACRRSWMRSSPGLLLQESPSRPKVPARAFWLRPVSLLPPELIFGDKPFFPQNICQLFHQPAFLRVS